MPIQIERKYIDDTLGTLYSRDLIIPLLGIHPNLSPKMVYREIDSTFSGINRANKIITDHIKLPTPISIIFDKIKTYSLTQGESFIHAQVESSFLLPIYGDPNLKNILIKIKFSSEIKNKPPEVIGAILAHENTHVILNLLRYQGQHEEVDTDLRLLF